MKKVFVLISVLAAFTGFVNGQITKGNWIVGGTVSYSYINYKSENFAPPHSAYALKIMPNTGYFIKDKLCTGIRVAISKTGSKSSGTSTFSKYTDFNIGPFARYYMLSSEKNINFLAEANYLYGFEGAKAGHTSKNTFVFSAGPVVYFNTSVGLEFLVSYSTYKFSEVKGSNGIIQIALGVQVHLQNDQ